MKLILGVLAALAVIALLADVIGWHSVKASGRRMTTLPLLYKPFVALWRLWRKT